MSKIVLPNFDEPIEIISIDVCECCGKPIFLSNARANKTIIRTLQPGTHNRWRHEDGFQRCQAAPKKREVSV
jgi:hypothetical protein